MDTIGNDLHEETINSLTLCLNCSNTIGVQIKLNGWWKPHCAYWNESKSTDQKLYGPESDCKYKLEHTVLDKRDKFKLSEGEDYIPLIEFMEKTVFGPDSQYIAWINYKGTKHEVLIIAEKKDIYLNNKAYSKDFHIGDVIDWINKSLRFQENVGLKHRCKYDKIFKDGNKIWVSEQIEENYNWLKQKQEEKKNSIMRNIVYPQSSFTKQVVKSVSIMENIQLDQVD